MGLLVLFAYLVIMPAVTVGFTAEEKEPAPAVCSGGSVACPSGYHNLYGRTGCYIIYQDLVKYDEANMWCMKRHNAGRLAVVETLEEHQVIKANFKGNYGYTKGQCNGRYWIGMERPNRTSCDSPFFWKKRFVYNPSTPFGTYREDVGFTAWGPGEPSCNRLSLGCAHYLGDHDYEWNDQDCNSRLCAICEAPISCTGGG